MGFVKDLQLWRQPKIQKSLRNFLQGDFPKMSKPNVEFFSMIMHVICIKMHWKGTHMKFQSSEYSLIDITGKPIQDAPHHIIVISTYDYLKDVNSLLCKQKNRSLRKLSSTLVYCGFAHYTTKVKLFFIMNNFEVKNVF